MAWSWIALAKSRTRTPGEPDIGASTSFHVATARYLRVRRFLTFDAQQRKLAEAEGLLAMDAR